MLQPDLELVSAAAGAQLVLAVHASHLELALVAKPVASFAPLPPVPAAEVTPPQLHSAPADHSRAPPARPAAPVPAAQGSVLTALPELPLSLIHI